MQKLRECWDRRDLLKHLVITNLKVAKKDLLLGYVWWILDPILLMFIYWMLVGVILGRGGRDYPLFVLCGLIPFRAITTTMGQSVTSISSKFTIISQINFPRVFLPLADVIANYIKLFFAFLIIIGFAIFYGIFPEIKTLAFFIPFFIQITLTIGITLILSIVGVFIKDFRNLIQFIVRIWLYASPVLYPTERVPADWQFYYHLNPMVPIITMYRNIFMYGKLPDINNIGIAITEGIILIIIGMYIYGRYESRILKAL